MQPQIQVLIDEIQAERDQQQALIRQLLGERDHWLATVEQLQAEQAKWLGRQVQYMNRIADLQQQIANLREKDT